METVHQDAEDLAETIKRIVDDAATPPAAAIDETTNQVIPPDTTHMTEEYAAQVAAKVTDLQGRIAAVLADGERMDAELARAITDASGEAQPAVKSADSLHDLLLPQDSDGDELDDLRHRPLAAHLAVAQHDKVALALP
ncbi:hypothetical protein MDOR_04800 [Mycolicibacterium doricum]|uniref:Uncharacterized protein n=1 Tax=Mycolicibacterium doricum TaxID=126673 RepID=A0A1X1TAZ3_9MYCO|nr:hypothetical protein [Mycolicibacterium doricum]ORV41687.1 hypothetical protein AWC01_09815 [Mycolicibacterium doricum]BBZ06311.1 hypothetical protein MDOR_04800 [Mycolicibacterium doricum]